MANVSFNEEPSTSGYSAASKKPYLIGLVLSTKIVSTDKQAEYVLVGVAALVLICALIMWPKGRPAPELDVTPVAGPSDVRQ